jgi:DNA-binding transcriptional ArsR family regulator
MTPRVAPRSGARPRGSPAAVFGRRTRRAGDRAPGDAGLDAVFHALAHPVRRQLLDLVRAHPGCNVNDACRPFALSRIAVMKHLRVLEQAGLLVTRKSGRSRELYFNVVPIQQVYDRWTDEYSALWARRLLDLKSRVEGDSAAGGRAGERGEADPDPKEAR